MDGKNILTAMLLMVVGLQTVRAQKFLIYKADNSTIELETLEVDSIVFVEAELMPAICPDDNHPHAIDLGLPSGTKWSCCNVGASTPEGSGGYYSWGEINEKESYTRNSYSNPEIISDANDVAYVESNGAMRMPTESQIRELQSNCTWTWESYNGEWGAMVKGGKKGKIFFPAAAFKDSEWGHFPYGNYGSYWGRTSEGMREYGDGKGAAFVPCGTEFIFGVVDPENEFSNSEFYYSIGNTGWAFCGRNVRAVCNEDISSIKLVNRIVLAPKELTMVHGTSVSIIATALPLSADNRDVTWSSSNPEIATVSATGRNAHVEAVNVGSCVIICSATDGSGVYAECPVTVQDNHEYVDLGLPSGTLWATCNVGANSPEEFGDYFAWGETQPKDDYLWDNYQHCKGTSTTLTKYCWYSSNGYNGFTDEKMELDSEDDAATVNWGINWQMPSKEQLEELLYGDYTRKTWITQNGVNGLLITSNNNGKNIFLPAAGFRTSFGISHGESWNGSSDGISGNLGMGGDYWSRSIDPSNYYEPYYRWFNSSIVFGQSFYQRYFGRNVRPVRKIVTNHEGIISK